MSGRKKHNTAAFVRMIKERCRFVYDQEQFKERLMIPLRDVIPFDASSLCSIKGASFGPPAIYFGFPSTYVLARLNQDLHAVPLLQRHFCEGPIRGYSTFRSIDLLENFYKTADYSQHYAPFGQRASIMSMFFDFDNTVLGIYSCNQFSDLPDITESQRMLFDEISPYVFYAFRKYSKLSDTPFYSRSSAPTLQEAVDGFIAANEGGKIIWLNDSARTLFEAKYLSVPTKLPAELVFLQGSENGRTRRVDKINLAFRTISHTTTLGEVMCFRIDECAASYLPVEKCKGWLYVIDTRRTEKIILETFSRRERQVLQLLKDGLSDKEIAAKLAVSDKTVQTYTRSLYKKFGVSNRTAAAIKAKTLLLL